MSNDGWTNLIEPGDHPIFHQIRVRPRGGIVAVWQRLEDGWRVTRVDSEGRVAQAEGKTYTDTWKRARASMRPIEQAP